MTAIFQSTIQYLVGYFKSWQQNNENIGDQLKSSLLVPWGESSMRNEESLSVCNPWWGPQGMMAAVIRPSVSWPTNLSSSLLYHSLLSVVYNLSFLFHVRHIFICLSLCVTPTIIHSAAISNTLSLVYTCCIAGAESPPKSLLLPWFHRK